MRAWRLMCFFAIKYVYVLLIWWNPVFPTMLSHTFWFQGSDSELSQSDLSALITHFVKTMVTLAKSVAGFSDLAPEQQVQVCSRSASQFIQFLLARCLGSKDPTEQLQWLLDIQRPQTSTGKKISVRIYCTVQEEVYFPTWEINLLCQKICQMA